MRLFNDQYHDNDNYKIYTEDGQIVWVVRIVAVVIGSAIVVVVVTVLPSAGRIVVIVMVVKLEIMGR